jgi:hypothetical protein
MIKEITFLEYYKIILEKVRFDNNLVLKEYRKALKQLGIEEINDLNTWLDSQGIRLSSLHVQQQEQVFH